MQHKEKQIYIKEIIKPCLTFMYKCKENYVEKN